MASNGQLLEAANASQNLHNQIWFSNTVNNAIPYINFANNLMNDNKNENLKQQIDIENIQHIILARCIKWFFQYI